MNLFYSQNIQELEIRWYYGIQALNSEGKIDTNLESVVVKKQIYKTTTKLATCSIHTNKLCVKRGHTENSGQSQLKKSKIYRKVLNKVMWRVRYGQEQTQGDMQSSIG